MITVVLDTSSIDIGYWVLSPGLALAVALCLDRLLLAITLILPTSRAWPCRCYRHRPALVIAIISLLGLEP